MNLEKTITELIHDALNTATPEELLVDSYLGSFFKDNYHTMRKICYEAVKSARDIRGDDKKAYHDELEDIVTNALEEIRIKCL